MNYTAPRLTKLGTVSGLTTSDIKCSPGQDFAYKSRWTHPNEEPFTHWTNQETGAQATPGRLIGSGNCQWVSIISQIP